MQYWEKKYLTYRGGSLMYHLQTSVQPVKYVLGPFGHLNLKVKIKNTEEVTLTEVSSETMKKIEIF